MEILDFLFEFIKATGHAPLPEDFTEGTGIQNNIAFKLRCLQMRGLLGHEVHTRYSQQGHAQTLAVTWVRHPKRGEAFVDEVTLDIFDPEVQERRCMCCTAVFRSSHKFNRLCTICSAAGAADQSSGLYEGEGYICNGLAIFSGGIGGTFIKRSRQR